MSLDLEKAANRFRGPRIMAWESPDMYLDPAQKINDHFSYNDS